MTDERRGGAPGAETADIGDLVVGDAAQHICQSGLGRQPDIGTLVEALREADYALVRGARPNVQCAPAKSGAV